MYVNDAIWNTTRAAVKFSTVIRRVTTQIEMKDSHFRPVESNLIE